MLYHPLLSIGWVTLILCLLMPLFQLCRCLLMILLPILLSSSLLVLFSSVLLHLTPSSLLLVWLIIVSILVLLSIHLRILRSPVRLFVIFSLLMRLNPIVKFMTR